MGKSPDVVRKYLGLGMLPQAGVSIGLAVIAQEHYPEIGNNLSAIVLSGVVFHEILGPLFAKIAIERAQEDLFKYPLKVSSTYQRVLPVFPQA